LVFALLPSKRARCGRSRFAGRIRQAISNHYRPQQAACLQHPNYQNHGSSKEWQPGNGRSSFGIFWCRIYDSRPRVREIHSGFREYRGGRESERRSYPDQESRERGHRTGHPPRDCGFQWRRGCCGRDRDHAVRRKRLERDQPCQSKN